MPELSSKPPSDLKINAGNKTEVKLKRTTMTVGKKTIHETGFCFSFDLKFFTFNFFPKMKRIKGVDKS